MGVLAPGVRRHKGPLGEAVAVVIIVDALAEDHGARAHGRGEEQLDVAAARRVQRDDGLHVLQVAHLGVGAGAGVRVDLEQDGSLARDLPEGTESSSSARLRETSLTNGVAARR